MEVVPFYVNHHNEVDAIDLLVEVQHLDAIVEVDCHQTIQSVYFLKLMLIKFLLFPPCFSVYISPAIGR